MACLRSIVKINIQIGLHLKLHKGLVIRGEFFPFVLVKDSNPKCTKLPALRN